MQQNVYQNENKLILACARNYHSQNNIKKIKSLVNQDLNWKYIFDTAKAHRVAPLMYQSLNEHVREHVPETFLKIFEKFYQASKKHGTHLSQNLAAIIRRLNQHNIFCITFKGPTLATIAYGDAGLRFSGDLDILIAKENVLKTIQLLTQNGFKLAKDLTKEELLKLIENYYECNLVNTDGTVVIDLHWSFSSKNYPFICERNYLTNVQNSVTIDNQRIPCLTIEDLLLYLCVHGSKHLWFRLEWICDIAGLIQSYPQIITPHLIMHAKKRGIQRYLALGLMLAKQLLDAPIPQVIINQLSGSSLIISTLINKINNELFENSIELSNSLTDTFYFLNLKGKLSSRFLYAFKLGKEHAKLRGYFLYPLIVILPILFLPSLQLRNYLKNRMHSSMIVSYKTT